VGADVARLLIEKRAFHVDAPNHIGNRPIFVAKANDVRHPAAHGFEIRRNDCSQNTRNAVLPQAPANGRDILRLQPVGVKIDFCVSVHLKVDVAVGSMHGGAWDGTWCSSE
jgi:hypothetical protein